MQNAITIDFEKFSKALLTEARKSGAPEGLEKELFSMLSDILNKPAVVIAALKGEKSSFSAGFLSGIAFTFLFQVKETEENLYETKSGAV